jgi:L-fucose isomerase
MTARILEAIDLPGGEKPVIYVASKVVQTEADASDVAEEFKRAGAGVICIVPDTWFYPGKTAIALTANFPDAPLCCIAGNNAPKPGVVGVDALVGAYAQDGRLCHAIIGNMPETGMAPEFDEKTRAEILDLVWAATAVVWLKGKRLFSTDVDSMQMETAHNPLHAIRRIFGLESTRESMKLFADMLASDTGYNKAELAELRDWVVNKQWKGRIYGNTQEICAGKQPIYSQPSQHPAGPLSELQRLKLDEELRLYLCLRDYMCSVGAIGGGFTSQLAWGSHKGGIPRACADIPEALFNSGIDHTGNKYPIPFATENDFPGLVTMTCYSALTGGKKPIMFSDVRKVYEPWEIQRKAETLGLKVDPSELYMQVGFVDMDNSGSGPISKEWVKESYLFQVDDFYFPGGGFSTGYISQGGIKCTAGRLGYSDLTGCFTMVQAEAQSVDLPVALAEAFAHASNYTWPHLWAAFVGLPASIVKYGCPANHMHLVQGLPRRRWQYFSDYARVLNYQWPNLPVFTEGLDRPEAMVYRLAGGETFCKVLLAGRR